MRRIIFLAALGLAGCGHHNGSITPEQAMILSGYMDRQAAINNASMHYQQANAAAQLNAISHIGPQPVQRAPFSCIQIGAILDCQ